MAPGYKHIPLEALDFQAQVPQRESRASISANRVLGRLLLNRLQPFGLAFIYVLPLAGLADISTSTVCLLWGVFLCIEVTWRQGPLRANS
jgi:hypothetical protein